MRTTVKVRHSWDDEPVSYTVDLKVSPQTRSKCAEAYIRICLQQHLRRPKLHPLVIFGEEIHYEVI